MRNSHPKLKIAVFFFLGALVAIFGRDGSRVADRPSHTRHIHELQPTLDSSAQALNQLNTTGDDQFLMPIVISRVSNISVSAVRPRSQRNRILAGLQAQS